VNAVEHGTHGTVLITAAFQNDRSFVCACACVPVFFCFFLLRLRLCLHACLSLLQIRNHPKSAYDPCEPPTSRTSETPRTREKVCVKGLLVRVWGSIPQFFGVTMTLLCFSIYLWATRCNQVGFKPIPQALRLECIASHAVTTPIMPNRHMRSCPGKAAPRFSVLATEPRDRKPGPPGFMLTEAPNKDRGRSAQPASE